METENKLPQRKTLRIPHYNYNANGSYFITFCTHHRNNLLIDHFCTDLSYTITRIWAKYSPYGDIVENCIKNANGRHGVNIDSYVVMPNHVHLLLSINDETIVDQIDKRSVISKVVGYIKMNATKEICSKFGKQKIWQCGFYDHIIRNQQDFDEISKYIEENPFKWNLDSLYNADVPIISIN